MYKVEVELVLEQRGERERSIRFVSRDPTCITKRTKVSGIQNHAAAWPYLEADSPALRVHSTNATSVSSSVASGDDTSMASKGGTAGGTHEQQLQLCCM